MSMFRHLVELLKEWIVLTPVTLPISLSLFLAALNMAMTGYLIHAIAIRHVCP